MKHWLAGVLTLLCLAAAVNAQTVQQIVNSIVATTCTNQFVRSIAGTGAGTCATVANADLSTMTEATIKGRALGAGTGTPTDLTATQVAAIVNSVGGALRMCLIGGTRDLTAATGSVAYTGCTFQPTTCLGFGNGPDVPYYTTTISAANSNLTVQRSQDTYGAATVFTGANTFYSFFDATGANNQNAVISSYDSDGITLAWTKTGTPTGTVSVRMVCFR